MIGGRKYVKLWFIISLIIIITMSSFSFIILPMVITEPTYHTIEFNVFERNESLYYNSEGKVYISSIELPKSIYPNQDFAVKINFVSENLTAQHVQIYSFNPDAFTWMHVNRLSNDKDIVISANKTTTIEINLISFEEAEYVKGIGPARGDLVDYGQNRIRLFVRESDADVTFCILEMPIELKSYSHVVITEYILIFGVIIVGCIISLKWHMDLD